MNQVKSLWTTNASFGTLCTQAFSFFLTVPLFPVSQYGRRPMSTSRFVYGLLIGFVCSTFCARCAQCQIIPTQPPGTVQQAVTTGEDIEAEDDVKWVSWPKITMPKVTMPKFKVPDMGKLFSPVSSGFEKVSAGSKRAWEGTKEMLSFSSKDSVPTKPYEPRQSLWKKLTTKKAEPTGPQTVGEFMSQPRLQH